MKVMTIPKISSSCFKQFANVPLLIYQLFWSQFFKPHKKRNPSTKASTHTVKCRSCQFVRRRRPRPASTTPPMRSRLATSAFKINVSSAQRASSATMGSHARNVHTAQLPSPVLLSAAHLSVSKLQDYRNYTFLWESPKSTSDYGVGEEGAVRVVTPTSIIHHRVAEVVTHHAISPSKWNQSSTSSLLVAENLKSTA